MVKCLLTSDDKSLIHALRLEKGWGSLRMIREFPQRQWKRSTLNDLIKKIDETGDSNRKQGSGQPRSVRTADNVAKIEELKANREQANLREKLNMKLVYQRIAKFDLQLKAFRRREVQLLSHTHTHIYIYRYTMHGYAQEKITNLKPLVAYDDN